MNHIFRSIWNVRTGTCVAVSELARAGGGSGSGVSGSVASGGSSGLVGCNTAGAAAGMRFAMPLLGAAIMVAFATPGWCGPTGGTVAAGSATIAGPVGNQTITQASRNAVLNWQGFNLAAGETVRFIQPDANAVALNRVLGPDPSSIFGTLSANGKVFLVNPNGILFGKSASVNVGGLVASTLDIADTDFMAGRYALRASGRAGVVNQGTITADGGQVALLGAHVANDGTILARLGSVALAAGSAMTIDLAGDGLLKLAVDAGAVEALARNGGLIQADGGQVTLSAKAAGGLLQGVVANTGVVRAQTIEHRAGRILLLGDMQTGTAEVAGSLDASAPVGGNGGFIETSAARVRVADGTRISTAAAHGLTGSWLVDPHDFTVAASDGDISGATLGATLDQTGVTLLSSSGAAGTGSGTGSIHINDPVSWSADTVLTLTASHHINVNASITATGANAGIALNPNTANGADGASGSGMFNLATGAAINLPNVLPTSTTALVIGGVPFRVLNSLGAEGSTSMNDLQGMNGDLTGHYALGSNIDASATASWNANAGFAPVGAGAGNTFTGTFDGLGHSIAGLTINRPGTDNIGLFGYADTSSILRNVGLTGGSFTGADYVGGLAGRSSGLVINTYNTGDVSDDGNQGYAIGGLIGHAYGTIDRSFATGRVTGGSYVGGLVGFGKVDISNSYAAGDVTGNGRYNIGGLTGGNYGAKTISNSFATGNVIGTSYVGGLNGGSDSTIVNSHASGSVTASGSSVGGLIGSHFSGDISDSYATGAVTGTGNTGGLVGDLGANVQRSYASGAVSGTDYVGGLAGDFYGPRLISDSYATGSVTANGNNVGGLVGYNGGGSVMPATSSIARSYATGVVSAGSGTVGGLVGASYANSGPVVDSYWDITASGQTTSAGGTGLTSAAIKQQASYSGFDFNPATGPWLIFENASAPLLRGFFTPITITAENAAKTYDRVGFNGNGVRYSVTPTSNLLGSAVYGGTAAGAVDVGNYVITPSGFSSAPVQQGYLISYVDGSLAITPKSLTVNSSVASKVYDGTLGATVNGNLVGVVSGDAVTLTQNGTFTSKNVGSAVPVNVSTSIGGASAGNYVLVQPTGFAADITPRPLNISVTAADRVYNGLTNASVTFADDRLSGDALAIAGTAAFADKNAGVNKIVNASGFSLSGIDAGNYLPNASASTIASITPRPLTISATGVDRIYNGLTNASVTYADNRLAGDTFVVAGSAAFADKNAGTNKSVSVSGIALSGSDAGNYTPNMTSSTTASIAPRSLTVAASGIDRSYNGLTTATVGLNDDRIAGDVLTAGYASASFNDKAAGTAKPVAVNGITLSGVDAANYRANSSAVTTAAITARALSVTAVGTDKQYDGNTTATVLLTDNRVAGDNLVLSTGTAAFADPDVGAAKAVTVSGITLAGPDAANYIANAAAATRAAITALPAPVMPAPVIPAAVVPAPVMPAPATEPVAPPPSTLSATSTARLTDILTNVLSVGQAATGRAIDGNPATAATGIAAGKANVSNNDAGGRFAGMNLRIVALGIRLPVGVEANDIVDEPVRTPR